MRMLVIRSFCRLSGQVSSRFMLKSGASSSFIRSSLNGNSTMSRRSLFESVVRPQLDKRKLEHLQTRLRMKRTTKELEQLADFEAELAKLGFFKRYMKLLGNYYHVVFTVHAITSAGWMALFYIMSQYL